MRSPASRSPPTDSATSDSTSTRAPGAATSFRSSPPLQEAGVESLAVRLADPPHDPTLRNQKLAILPIGLPDEHDPKQVLRVHPELSLNRRPMPLDKAAYELARRLRPSTRKTVGVVVSPEAQWQQLVDAMRLARHARAKVVRMSEQREAP